MAAGCTGSNSTSTTTVPAANVGKCAYDATQSAYAIYYLPPPPALQYLGIARYSDSACQTLTGMPSTSGSVRRPLTGRAALLCCRPRTPRSAQPHSCSCNCGSRFVARTFLETCGATPLIPPRLGPACLAGAATVAQEVRGSTVQQFTSPVQRRHVCGPIKFGCTISRVHVAHSLVSRNFLCAERGSTASVLT